MPYYFTAMSPTKFVFLIDKTGCLGGLHHSCCLQFQLLLSPDQHLWFSPPFFSIQEGFLCFVSLYALVWDKNSHQNWTEVITLLLRCFCVFMHSLRESEKSCLISVVHNHLKSVLSIHISSSREHLDLQYVFSATFRSRENSAVLGLQRRKG